MPEPIGESIRVLIVDDIAEFRENIRKLLQFEKDIEVVGAARTGQEGLEVARATRPHVVIMDINMPDMDGISVTRELLRTSSLPRSSSSRFRTSRTTCARRCGPAPAILSPSLPRPKS